MKPSLFMPWVVVVALAACDEPAKPEPVEPAPAPETPQEAEERAKAKRLYIAAGALEDVDRHALRERHRGPHPCLRYGVTESDNERGVAIAKELHKVGVTSSEMYRLTELMLFPIWAEASLETKAHGATAAEELKRVVLKQKPELAGPELDEAAVRATKMPSDEDARRAQAAFDRWPAAKKSALQRLWKKDPHLFGGWNEAAVAGALDDLESGRDPLARSAVQDDIRDAIAAVREANANVDAGPEMWVCNPPPKDAFVRGKPRGLAGAISGTTSCVCARSPFTGNVEATCR